MSDIIPSSTTDSRRDVRRRGRAPAPPAEGAERTGAERTGAERTGAERASLRPAEGTPANPLADPAIWLAHLARRAGFGASPAELAESQRLGFAGTVDRLIDPGSWDRGDDLSPISRFDVNLGEDLRDWWLLRMRYTSRPLIERMVLFWHGLLTSSLAAVVPVQMYRQNQLFREHALGNFGTLLKAIAKDPAMMNYLNIAHSRRDAPNENFARELLELFSMGPGHYTESDVRESARAFTGWRVNAQHEVFFTPATHDDGIKTFLDRTGRFTGDDIVDIILDQPATGVFIARKLFSWFAYPDPPDAIIADLARDFVAAGYDLRRLVRDILTSPAFVSPAAYRAIVKGPIDLVVGARRVLDLDLPPGVGPVELRRLGQDLLRPPNVAGWAGGPAWFSSTYFFNRVNFADDLVRRRTVLVGAFDPAAVVAEGRLETVDDLVRQLAGRLVDGVLSPTTATALIAYAGNGQGATAPLPREAGRRDTVVRGTAYLLLASPEYQLL